jgi:hypothetical protein
VPELEVEWLAPEPPPKDWYGRAAAGDLQGDPSAGAKHLADKVHDHDQLGGIVTDRAAADEEEGRASGPAQNTLDTASKYGGLTRQYTGGPLVDPQSLVKVPG